jgi:hypothetical protein
MLFQRQLLSSIKNSTSKEPCGEGVFSFQTKSKLFYHRRSLPSFFKQCATYLLYQIKFT